MVFFVLLTGVSVAMAITCPDDYIHFHESCYHFGHRSSDFTEAEHYCRQRRGTLVQIETSLENDFIKSHAREMQRHFWWIGLTDEMVEGHFMWTVSNEEATFTDWATNQPQGGHENCVGLEETMDFMWGDFPCTFSDRIYPICEYTESESTFIG